MDGSSPEAYYLRGEALYKTQNMEQAKKHYQVGVTTSFPHCEIRNGIYGENSQVNDHIG